MKKAIFLSIVMLGFTVISSANDIKVHTYLVSEVYAECVEVYVVVTEIREGTETVVSYGSLNLGSRCADQNIKTPLDSSVKDLKETMKANPVIQRRLDDWYDEYVKKQAERG